MKNYLKNIGFAAFLLVLAVLLLLSLFWALSIGNGEAAGRRYL